MRPVGNDQQARLAQIREDKLASLKTGVLIVVRTFYHQLGGMDATSVDTRYQRQLDTDEQPYVRHISLSESDGWVSFDAGWLTNVGASYLQLRNNVGAYARYPTKEEKEDTLKRVVDISFTIPPMGAVPHIEVRPGEAQAFSPSSGDMSHIRLKCRHGTAKISINIIPK
jgi:hypothetical protein